MSAFVRMLAGVLLTPAVYASPAAEPVSTQSLVREMTDLRALPEFPDPAFRTIQFSSYDRRSEVPGGPGWFSNSDGFGGAPIPAFEAVLKESGDDGIGEFLVCDIQSPGAIVRCWTAAINGQVRVWLDDAPDPVFDGSADDFFRRPFNVLAKQVGVDPAIFDATFNQQNATYCPIPFARRCRIVWIGNPREVHFYEVQVRVYEPDAEVTTFSPQDLVSALPTIRRTAAELAAPGEALDPRAGGEQTWNISTTIQPGVDAGVWLDENGPQAITRLTLQLQADDLDRALRQTVLHIHFDGAPHAQVESPVGDFFGAAPGINPFDSVPFTVALDGTMTCRLVMPYARSARLHAENLGDQPVSIELSATVDHYDWQDASSMHLRARWRVDHGLVADPRHPQDIPFLVAQGTGRYVGTASIMLNPTDIPTPGGGWWGEGDEKVFVDHDTTPSTFGTGSEDYYNYAWSIPDIFGFAYCGQPRNDGPGNRGFVTNHRWHILDSLPFHERIAFYMELWPHDRVPGFSYARLSWHYARPGLIDDHLPITPEDVRPLDLAPDWQPRAAGGARNSTFIQAEDCISTSVAGPTFAHVEGNLSAGSRLLRWSPERPGETLDLRFDIAEGGTYAVDLCALKSGDSGAVSLWVNDLPGDGHATRADLFSPGRHILRRVGTEPVELDPGAHTLHVRFEGPPGRTVAIDFLWIQRR